MQVFAYGSLMCPVSLRGTVPDVALDHCAPAVCLGRTRTFGVACPNDGGQPDTHYLAADGSRPSPVLYCDIPVRREGRVNGVCIPVGRKQMAALVARERRYRVVDITDRVRRWDGAAVDGGPVVAFVGAERFIDPDQVGRGTLAHGYLQTVRRGALWWEARAPGFWELFMATTELPPTRRIRPLIRLAAAGCSRRGPGGAAEVGGPPPGR